jgi:hypothetical protein
MNQNGMIDCLSRLPSQINCFWMKSGFLMKTKLPCCLSCFLILIHLTKTGLNDPELLTADDPPDRLDDDRLTPEDLDVLLPAADCNADDAALPRPRRIALPAEFDFEPVLVIRVMVRAGDEVGRKFRVSIRSAEGGVMLLESMLCVFLPSDTPERPDSLPVVTRDV